MKISLSPIQYFDMAGVPLAAGRLSIYLHGSNNLAHTFVMDGDSYIDGPNPVILDDSGEMVNSIFVEASVYDVTVDKYVDGSYEQVSQFQFGFEPQDGKNDTVVDGIEGLTVADTALGVVTVVGYDNNVWAGPRTYIWDPSCTANADGGCIIESETTEDGRWLLLSDLRELPCTYYGIAPGNEANISAFLTYQETVGQWGIVMPPVPRFLKGTYTSPGTFSVTKTISFDEGVKFTNATIECKRVEVTGCSDYIADFYFDDNQQVAHSSWFRTAMAFLECNAKHMVFDSTNHFTDDKVKYEVVLTNVMIDARARLPVTYVNTGKLKLDGCSFVGTQFFNSNDILTFAHTEFKQDWFSTSLNAWDFANKVIVRSSSMNRILLSNFKDPSVYVKAMEADGKHEIDMAGRTVSSFSSSYISTIHNLVCTGTMSISRPTDNVVLDNVDCQAVNISCLHLNVYNSKIKFWPEPSCTAIFGQYSDIASQYAFVDPTIQISMYNCKFGIALNRATDNATRDSVIVLQDCLCYDNLSIKSKNLVMQGCTTNNAIIKIYPYYTSGVYYITFVLRDNVFNNADPIEITKVDQDECYECIANWVIQGNTFLGNSEGLRCRYWSNRTGSYFDKIFIVTDTRSVITYNGNCGSCPAESAKGWVLPTGEPYNDAVDIGSGNYVYLYWYSAGRAMPKFTQLESASLAERLYRLVCHAPSTTMFLDTNDGNRFKMQNGAFYWQTSRAFNDRDGDFFQLGFALWINQLDSHDGIMVV